MCENEEMKEMMSAMHELSSDSLKEAVEALKQIDYNEVFKNVLDKIENIGGFIKEAKNDIMTDNKIEKTAKELKKTIELIHNELTRSKEISAELSTSADKLDIQPLLDKLETQSEENVKNIKKVLLKMTELKFDSDSMYVGDFEHIKEQLEIVLDALGV